MLPRAHRLASGDDIRTVVRRGRKLSSSCTVTYRIAGRADGPARFAVIVSKQVGGAVVRNRVRRRIQAACALAVNDVPPGDLIVVRALPASSEASWDTLRSEIGNGVRRAVRVS